MELHLNSLKYLEKTPNSLQAILKGTEILLNSFYEANNTLISKADKGSRMIKETLNQSS